MGYSSGIQCVYLTGHIYWMLILFTCLLLLFFGINRCDNPTPHCAHFEYWATRWQTKTYHWRLEQDCKSTYVFHILLPMRNFGVA